MVRALFVSLVCALPAFGQGVVRWAVETPNIPSTRAGDPALTSVLVGTDTAQTGIFVYGLGGQLSDTQPVGIVRSADTHGSLLAVSSGFGSVLLFKVGSTLVPETPPSFSVSSPGQLALGGLGDGGITLWVDTSSQVVRHFELTRTDAGWTPAPLTDVTLPGTPSGLAWNERDQVLYAAVPNVGVVTVAADGTQATVIPSSALGSVLGGVALYLADRGDTFVFTTSPAADEILVHAVSGGTATLAGSFQIGAPDGGAPRTRSPAFLDLEAKPLPGFPLGALAVQDGVVGNYKLVSLGDLAGSVTLPPPWAGGGAVPDAGTGTGADAGSQQIVGDPPPRAAPSAAPTPGCSTAPLVMLPALLLLWWIRRPRS